MKTIDHVESMLGRKIMPAEMRIYELFKSDPNYVFEKDAKGFLIAMHMNMPAIRHKLMHLFADSIGWEFRVKGFSLVDVCEGVNWKLQTVKGRTYGEFGIDLVELTGRSPEDLTAAAYE